MNDRWRGRSRDQRGAVGTGLAAFRRNAVPLCLVAATGAAPLSLLALATRPLEAGLLSLARDAVMAAAAVFPAWGLAQAALAAVDGEAVGPNPDLPGGRLGWQAGSLALVGLAAVWIAQAAPPVDGFFWAGACGGAAAAAVGAAVAAAAYPAARPARPMAAPTPFWIVWFAGAVVLSLAVPGSGPAWERIAASGWVPAAAKSPPPSGDVAAAFAARVKVEAGSQPGEVRLTDRKSGAVAVVPTDVLHALIAARDADGLEQLFSKPAVPPPPAAPAPAPPSHAALSLQVAGTGGIGMLATSPLPEWMPVPSGARTVQHLPTMDGSGGSYVLEIRRSWTETARLYERRLEDEGYAVSRNDIVGGASMGTVLTATLGDDPAFTRTLQILVSKDGAGAEVQGTYQEGGGEGETSSP